MKKNLLWLTLIPSSLYAMNEEKSIETRVTELFTNNSNIVLVLVRDENNETPFYNFSAQPEYTINKQKSIKEQVAEAFTHPNIAVVVVRNKNNEDIAFNKVLDKADGSNEFWNHYCANKPRNSLWRLEKWEDESLIIRYPFQASLKVGHQWMKYLNILIFGKKSIKLLGLKALQASIQEDAQCTLTHWDILKKAYENSETTNKELNKNFPSKVEIYDKKDNFFHTVEIEQKTEMKEEIERIKRKELRKMGRVVKNYLGVYTPGISLISKKGIQIIYLDEQQKHSIVLPQPALETIAKHYSLQ